MSPCDTNMLHVKVEVTVIRPMEYVESLDDENNVSLKEIAMTWTTHCKCQAGMGCMIGW